ncbi:hypothetical protein ACQRIT_002414 [Beauveria bassiana]
MSLPSKRASSAPRPLFARAQYTVLLAAKLGQPDYYLDLHVLARDPKCRRGSFDPQSEEANMRRLESYTSSSDPIAPKAEIDVHSHPSRSEHEVRLDCIINLRHPLVPRASSQTCPVCIPRRYR